VRGIHDGGPRSSRAELDDLADTPWVQHEAIDEWPKTGPVRPPKIAILLAASVSQRRSVNLADI
jgi:hypothetical protein